MGIDAVGSGGRAGFPVARAIPPHGDPQRDWDEGDWRAIAESIPHMVWLSSLDGRSVYFNQQGLEYAGLPFDAITWQDLIHPEDLAAVRTAWSGAVRAESVFDGDYRLRRSDGVYRWHDCRSRPVRDDQGKVVRWLGTATDITERKELETQLVAAEHQALQAMNLLAAMQAAAPIGFGFVDRDLRVVRLNEAIEQSVDLPATAQVGRTVAEIVPDHWAALEPLYRRVLDAGESVLNLAFTRPGPGVDESPTEWLASLYPVRVEDEIVGVGIVVVDITERVRAERLRTAVMSQVVEGVYAQDGRGLFTYMNRAAARMLGWGEEELRGRSMHELVHPHRIAGKPVDLADCPLCTPGLGRRNRRGGGEFFTRKDGTRFPVAYSTLPLGLETQPEGVSVVFHDVSGPGGGANLIRILLAADGERVAALAAILSHHDGFDVVSSATTAASAADQAQHLHPDVVVVDAELAAGLWHQTVTRVLAEVPGTVLLLLAPSDDEEWAATAIAAGCAGAVEMSRAWVDLPAAVRTAHHGEVTITHAQLQKVVRAVRDRPHTGGVEDLTAREREVLVCLTHGLSNAQAAERLGVSLNTVRNHAQRILYKLGVHSRLEAVVLANRSGLLDPLE